MPAPIVCSPLLHLLALRAAAVLGPSRGDAWAGTFLAMERAIGEGSERAPVKWMVRWPAAVQEGFWQAAARSWPPHAAVPVEALVAGMSRRPARAWGQWAMEGPADFGLLPIASPGPLPASIHAVGVVPRLEKEGFSAETLACVEAAKEQGVTVWLDVPPSPEEWAKWTPAHWKQSHRIGAATWLRPPAHEAWGDYSEFMAAQTAYLVRQPGWEQWSWPICNLLEYALEDVLIYGKPNHRTGLPWKSDGRGKASDWLRLRKQLWESASAGMGGAGTLEEVLVATVLAKDHLLLP